MMINPLTQIEEIVLKALSSQAKLRKPFVKFFIDTVTLFLTIHDKVNFTQMSRYGKFCESTYRQNFKKNMDWMKFNQTLLPDCTDEDDLRAIAIDPSYISKSGKKTPGLGYFWSGCAGAAKKGLEILGFACVGVNLNEGYFLKAEQTFKDKKLKGKIPKYLKGLNKTDSLIAWYLRMIEKNGKQLKTISNIIVADAYFSKETFTTGLGVIGFDLISRFRDDVRLNYIYRGEQRTGKGRRKKYDGPVVLDNLKEDVFTTEVISDRDEEIVVHSATVWAVSLKREVKVVIADYMNSDKKTLNRKIYFSTNLELEAGDIVKLYRARFKIEFVFRDAKEYTALTNCQSRIEESLDFAFNMSGTAVNIAKKWAKDNDMEISVGSVKRILQNAAMIDRIISMLGKTPNMRLNSTDFKDLLFLGVRSTLKGQNLGDFSRNAS